MCGLISGIWVGCESIWRFRQATTLAPHGRISKNPTPSDYADWCQYQPAKFQLNRIRSVGCQSSWISQEASVQSGPAGNRKSMTCVSVIVYTVMLVTWQTAGEIFPACQSNSLPPGTSQHSRSTFRKRCGPSKNRIDQIFSWCCSYGQCAMFVGTGKYIYFFFLLHFNPFAWLANQGARPVSW